MPDYKNVTMNAYNTYANTFEEKYKTILPLLHNEINKFLELLPHNGKILDIGSGPGVKAKYIENKGYSVTCVDSSKEMVIICSKKGLQSFEMDLEQLLFRENTFDGVIAYTSLLHIPKSNLDKVLNRISEILKNKGVILIGMKQGSNEGFVSEDIYSGTERWFSHYNKEELENHFKKYFDINFTSETQIAGKTFLNHIMIKKY